MSGNNVFEIAIDGLAQGGEGVGRLADGRVVFVARGVPGDVARIELTRSKKRFAKARVIEIVSRSPSRMEPACPYFERGCGGCQFQHVSLRQELAWKSEAAFEAMTRISGLELPKPNVFEAPSPERYRNRVTFHLRNGRLGFYEAGSHDLIDVRDCLITMVELNEARRRLEPVLANLGAGEVLFEIARAGEVVVTMTLDGRLDRATRTGLESLVTDHGLFRGIAIKTADETLCLGRCDIAAERALARSPVDGAFVPSGQFRQANESFNKALVDHVGRLMESIEVRNVLELYCGAGNFAFALADQVESLVGIEGSSVAIETARALAVAGKKEHLRFEVADLAGGLGQVREIGLDVFNEVDAVLLDPPRQGAAAICQELAEHGGPRHLVYVSCDPACLARDLKTLSDGGYRVREIAFYDMFPRTAHLETVAHLERR